jgi:membrane protein
VADATQEARAREPGRGREADRPRQIPLRGWKDIAIRVKDEVRDDRISVVAASVAFYAMLAVFPGLIAIVSLYGLVADPADVQSQITSMSEILPAEVRTILDDQMRSVVESPDRALGISLLVSILAALWAASGGMQALIVAINIAYDEDERRRGLVRGKLTSLLFTVAGLVGFAVAVMLLGVLPAIFDVVGLGRIVTQLLDVGRWPLLALLSVLAMEVLYRYAPARARPKWRWVSWGSVIATALWLGSSALFSLYVSNFGKYNETYGALGGVVVLLLWLYLSAFSILLGAEINAEIEHQTAKDSTTGPPRPLGERGARMADTVGPAFARS